MEGGGQGGLSSGIHPLSMDIHSHSRLPLPLQTSVLSSGLSYGLPSSQRSSTSSFSPRYFSSTDQNNNNNNNNNHVSTPSASSILIRLPPMMPSPVSSASNTPRLYATQNGHTTTPPRLFSTQNNGITPPRFTYSTHATSRPAHENSPSLRHSHHPREGEDDTYRSSMVIITAQP